MLNVLNPMSMETQHSRNDIVSYPVETDARRQQNKEPSLITFPRVPAARGGRRRHCDFVLKSKTTEKKSYG